ncbi:hypothetical protein ACT17_23075 [Mycolicibacterium conceptionense]|uniref:Uncharacterized protein n=1 Tax=Mycolicibacterium conceptionense TaxID=451644 RepID=A0A0J8U6A7_9MYCO|nr:hypothetical protein [Mycolicibacterium conceptionense]KMV15975.1 hypothetical protein ACT17_23075 [Mycolicibacterium conceptionense]
MNNTDYPNYPHRDLNEGCGHIYPRPDGMKMRCGSWESCPGCTSDALDAATAWVSAAIAHGDREEITQACLLLSGAGRVLRKQRDAAVGANMAQLAARESSFSPAARGLFQTMPAAW